jgi:hypothetical protein
MIPFSISLRLINGSSLVVIKWNPAIVTCILIEYHWLIQLIALQFDDFAESSKFQLMASRPLFVSWALTVQTKNQAIATMATEADDLPGGLGSSA